MVISSSMQRKPGDVEKKVIERDPTKIGKRVRESRLAKNYSLQDLADRVGVSISYLSKVESGAIKEPAGPVLVRLARVFDWSMEELYECCVSEEEARIDQQIRALEDSLAGSSNAQLVIEGCRSLRGDLRGKKYYLALLQELQSRLESNQKPT